MGSKDQEGALMKTPQDLHTRTRGSQNGIHAGHLDAVDGREGLGSRRRQMKGRCNYAQASRSFGTGIITHHISIWLLPQFTG
jgi:hypothetical protein